MRYLCLLCLFACRPDLDAPQYPERDVANPTTTISNFLPGAEPWQEGTPRLFLSVFYEGGFTDQIVIDDVSRHYYIWENTYDLLSDSDHVEGLASDRIEVGNLGWWGGGIFYDVPEDLSAWSYLAIALKSDLPEVDILVSTPTAEARVQASTYGYVGDEQWAFLVIPTADFALDFTAVTSPLSLTAPGSQGQYLLLDDVYYGVTP